MAEKLESSAGCVSHHMNILRIGQQLASRGHTFTLLLSAQEHYSHSVLDRRLSENVRILLYEGDPTFKILGKRPEDKKQPKAARDPAQVRNHD